MRILRNCSLSLILALILLVGSAMPARSQAGDPSAQMASVLRANKNFRDGMLAYQGGEYKKAVPSLKSALEELKTDPKFETSTVWRALVDNLGMAYGITNDLKSAKSTFDYGISKDPTYPMFHYNLACTFAETGDRDKAIAELKQAFAFKANAITGESIPNPATDESFKKYMKDKAFLAALSDIRKIGRLYPDRLDFTSPGAPWVMTLTAGDFEISETKLSPDGKQAYFLFSSEKTGLTASIFIEPAAQCRDSKTCRDAVRTAELPRVPNAENVSSSEIGDTSVFEYFLPLAQGQPVRQHNLYAEYVREGFWVDLHISKVLFKQEDRAAMEALVRSATFEKKK